MNVSGILCLTLMAILLGTDYLKRIPKCGPAFWRKVFKENSIRIYWVDGGRAGTSGYVSHVNNKTQRDSTPTSALMAALRDILALNMVQEKLRDLDLPNGYLTSYQNNFSQVLELVFSFKEGDQVTLPTDAVLDEQILREVQAQYARNGPRDRSQALILKHKTRNEVYGPKAPKFLGYFPNVLTVNAIFETDGLGILFYSHLL